MDKDIKKRCIIVLDCLSDGMHLDLTEMSIRSEKAELLNKQCLLDSTVKLLLSGGYLCTYPSTRPPIVGARYGITIQGYEYHRRLRHPIREWVRENWFPVTIAIVTAVAGVASAISGFWPE